MVQLPEFMTDPAVNWPDFLLSQGASRAREGQPDLIDFPLPAQAETGFLCALTHLGVIAASGDDAEHFLHNQLSNDVTGLTESHASLAGYCSPKGRLLATLLIWRSDGQVLMALPRELLAPTMKRLQMFVLRSKVKLQDVSDQLALIGLAGSELALPAQPWQRSALDGGMLLRVPDAAGLQRALWAGPIDAAQRRWTDWSAHWPAAPASLWRWSEIIAGLPQVLEATREQFVPQMINFELVGGVNFRKGCYPGQEIVARSQYLGKLKRRALLAFTSDTAAAAGVEVFSVTDPAQPCGMIVNAERGPDGRIACLVEMKLEASTSPVHLRAADGPLLSFGQLPYDLSAEL
jgi:folate-binding protein YgfZ